MASSMTKFSVFSFHGSLLTGIVSSFNKSGSCLKSCKAAYSSSLCARGAGSAPVQSARDRRMERTALLRQKRKDPELEKAARTSSLVVPLDDVQREWRAYRGLDQLKTAGKHFNIFKDMFGGQSFRPLGFMEVAYGEKMVHRGTILTPSEALCSPRVNDLPSDGLCTLILSNPDGHLLDHTVELLHWMVINISEGDILSGHEIVPYLQPIPPQGSGLHRYIFTLYTHHNSIHIDDNIYSHHEGSWLDQRTFSTVDFLSAHPSLSPFTFNIYQCQWDTSVHTAYMENLVYPEPVYGLEREMTARSQRQVKTRLLKANHYRLMSV